MISECTRVLNIPGFWTRQGYTTFWIKYFGIVVWQYFQHALDSKYAMVLNMPGLHKVVNKLFHHRYLTGFWICLSFEKTSVTQGSVENSPSYMFVRFLSIPWALNMPGSWICQGYTCFCVNCILKILSIFNVLSSEYAKVLNMLNLRDLNKILHRVYLTGFWIYHGFKICQGSEYIRVLNMSGFIKKTLHHIDAWQGTDYFSGSAYTRVLNMPGLGRC